jgi:ACS family tartrate transporter-like MFS transporter
MTAMAVSNIIGAPISMWILENTGWWGMAGWRWLFIIEGTPAIVFGIATWMYLTDRPEEAAWLDDDEKRLLAEEITQGKSPAAFPPFRILLADPGNWCLGSLYCSLVIALYGLGFWLPLTARQLNPSFSLMETGMVLAAIYGTAGCTMIAWGRHSDRTGERRLHTLAPTLTGGVCLATAGLAPCPPLLSLLLLACATACIYCSFGPFWTLPTLFAGGIGTAVCIAMINSIGNMGGGSLAPCSSAG